MDAGLVLRGLAIGFAVAAALGPIGLLVIRRTVDRGFGYGLVSGIGVATADATYAAIAAFGLTALTEVLVAADRLLGIVGGMLLLVLAVRAGLAAWPAGSGELVSRPDTGRRAGPLGAWASMVGLTLTNPATIIAFAALFASLGAGAGGAGGAMLVTGGVFLGSVAWWVLLTALTASLRTRLTARAVRLLNLASAAVIGAFGAGAIAFGVMAS